MEKIISLTGPSGSGKKTLVRKLLEIFPSTCMIQSYTTRPARDSDLLGEYHYVAQRKFSQIHQAHSFLWTAQYGGNYYATSTQSVLDVFEADSKTGLMILVPSVIPVLINFLQHLEEADSYVPIFITPPDSTILKERLIKRGDSEDDISRRLQEAGTWYEEAKKSDIPYTYINNDKDIESTVCSLINLLQPPSTE